MMPAGLGSPFGSIRLISNALLVDGPFEDWSEVRSHGRARRRRRKHPQRIRVFYRPSPKLLRLPDGSIVAHPETLDRLRKAIEARS